MKLACVIHRFGADIAGGSESHCRVVAEHLALTHDVTILTTCAKDHVTWKNHYPRGQSQVGPLSVLRFPVARQRDLHRFMDISDLVFADRASPVEQEQWFRENGPDTPELLDHLRRHGAEYDRLLFWSYRYYHSYFGVPLVAARAVLVPTAEEDSLIRVDALDQFFALPAGYVYLTPEEAELVGARAPARTPSAIIGCGLDPVARAPDLSRLDDLGIEDPFVLYLGRIDPNKGCAALIRNFLRYVSLGRPIQLVMAGPSSMEVPDHASIRALGFVEDDVREALLARARVLVMPSPFESLSMVLLEAWNHGLPVLVNARCRVTRGQTVRADGGLYYRNVAEFEAALEYLLTHDETRGRLGAQGRAYVDREYRWPTVLERLETLLRQC
ncbi:MAG TPA: glycosyltransferase family 4 protein [Vicinamibacterales bacterium]|nr:glycosyltransferase family 4 protein [Vicinamibacterales bacterium]